MNSRIDSLDMHSSVFHGPWPGTPPPLAPPGVVGAVSSETLWARMQLLWAGSEAQLVLVAGVGEISEYHSGCGVSSAGQCKQCGPGRFKGAAGTDGCSLCASGTFADGPGYESCQPCGSQQYQDESGSASCKFCNYHLGKNRHGATAEAFCCEQYEDVHGQDGFQLKDGGASEGRPKKLKTLPKKTMAVDGVEGPDKEDVASIKNAGWL